MQETVKMWDASDPTFEPPMWLKIVSGYIGGDTPHVWTREQWNRFGDRKKLPIFVRSLSGSPDGNVDGWEIVKLLFELGVPKGTPVVIDMETTIDPEYVLAVHRILHFVGYQLWVYGSVGFVFGNPMCDGYWPATLDGIPQMVNHPGVKATQYVDRGEEDTSLVHEYVYEYELKTW